MEAYYQVCIERELSRRVAANPRYSLRALARATKVDVSVLSRILGNKLLPSPKVAERLVHNLGLAPSERGKFLQSIHLKRHRNTLATVMKEAGVSLDEEMMEILSDWYHIALLELTQTKGFRNDSRRIARQLGITELEAKLSVQKLLRCGLVEERGDKLVRVEGMLRTKDKSRTTAALRRRQEQVLRKAVHSLVNDPLEERSHTAVTMAIDEAKLPEAKRLISEFNKKLCELLESGPQTRVYELSVALFPVQTKENE